MAATVKLELKAAEVFRGFERMERQAQTLGKAFRILKPDLRADQREHAAQQSGPDGKWPARASGAYTERRNDRGRTVRQRNHHIARRPLGRLVTAVNYVASNRSLIAKSAVAWSGVHQEGGKVGNNATLPARPFLWISDRMVDKVTTVIARVVAYAFGGG